MRIMAMRIYETQVMVKQNYQLGELAKLVNADFSGDANVTISKVTSLDDADSSALSYVRNKKFAKQLRATAAAAVLVTKELAEQSPVPALIVNNPELAFAKIASLFLYQPKKKAGIHPTAVIGEACEIDSSVIIGPHCVIGDHVKIGARTEISAGTVIGDYCEIAADCLLHANVTLYHSIHVGQRVIIHSGAVLGADGFGFVQDDEKIWHKVPQLGGVRISDDVEIGANTCVDRGALQDTVIKRGAKLDNLIQVAHNVEIGQHTAIAGSTGIAGSTKIGNYCQVGGAARIRDHIEIADHVFVAAASNVAWSLKSPGIYSGGFAALEKTEWMNNIKRFYQLDGIYQRLRKVEKKIDERSN